MSINKLFCHSLFSFLALSVANPKAGHADLLTSAAPLLSESSVSTQISTEVPLGSVMVTSGHSVRLGQKLEINGYSKTDSYASLLLRNPDGSMNRLTQNQFLSAGVWQKIAPHPGHSLYAVEPVGRTKIFLVLSTSPLVFRGDIRAYADFERTLQQIPDFTYSIITSYVDVIR